MTDKLKIADLIKKELTGEITPEEARMLRTWIAASETNRAIYERLCEKSDLLERLNRYTDCVARSDFNSTIRRAEEKRNLRKRSLVRRCIGYAAVLVPLIVIAGVLAVELHNHRNQHQEITHNSTSARLVLSTGECIELGDLTIAQPLAEGNAIVDSCSAGYMLSYKKTKTGFPRQDIAEKESTVTETPRTIARHTLIVPRGVNYNLELADGTIVYLDADSRLEYPVSFTDGSREVSVSGRAYFKVAREENRPFIVHTGWAQVKVFGTEFCVSDDGGKSLTTLVSGSVGLYDREDRLLSMLVPGQQACVDASGCSVKNVETLYYTAWKDGYFIFDSLSVREILEELSTWYDVNYVVDDSLPDISITARIKRYPDMKSVLEILSKTRSFNFQQNGRVITVSR